MSAHAKTVAAAFGTVVFAVITAWQALTADGLQLSDLIPLAIVLVGAVQTQVVPNVPELPWAKAVVAGSAAVLSGVATVVGTTDPAGVTAGKLLTAAAMAFLVWFVPNLDGEILPAIPGMATIPGSGGLVFHSVPSSQTTSMGATTQPMTVRLAPRAPTPAVLIDGGTAASDPPLDGGHATDEPTPLGDAAQQAAEAAHAAALADAPPPSEPVQAA